MLRFLGCFLTSYMYKELQLTAEQISKYILQVPCFTCLIAIDINLFLIPKNWYHKINIHVRNNKKYLESNFREAKWSILLTKQFFNKCEKNVIISSIFTIYMQSFPPSQYWYPWRLSQTIWFKSKCNLALS